MASKVEAVEKSNEQFVEARKTMADEFRHDPDLRFVYVCNIAMLLYDKYGIRNYDVRNEAADDILNLIFGE